LAVLDEFLTRVRARTEAALDARLPPAALAPTHLHAAMRYASLGGGKRLRAALVYATGEALGAAPETLDAPACALELIHAYSLVHDDLPAMDNDDLRRGKPTVHKAFDEATAILAGDALQTLAFELLARDPTLAVPPATRLVMITRLAEASGAAGMAGAGVRPSACVAGNEITTVISPNWTWSPLLMLALAMRSPFTRVPRVDPKSMS